MDEQQTHCETTNDSIGVFLIGRMCSLTALQTVWAEEAAAWVVRAGEAEVPDDPAACHVRPDT